MYVILYVCMHLNVCYIRALNWVLLIKCIVLTILTYLCFKYYCFCNECELTLVVSVVILMIMGEIGPFVDFLTVSAMAALTISPRKVRPVTDPILQMLDQVHRIIYLTQVINGASLTLYLGFHMTCAIDRYTYLHAYIHTYIHICRCVCIVSFRAYFSVQLITICAVVKSKCAV